MKMWNKINNNPPHGEVIGCDAHGNMLIGFISKDINGYVTKSEHEIMTDTVAWMDKPQPIERRSNDRSRSKKDEM